MENETRDDWERRMAQAERAHAENRSFFNASNQSGIEAANTAIRTVFLINGGSAVAMLTFLGTTVSAKQDSRFDIAGLAVSLQWFCWGIAVVGFASCLVYISHRAILESIRSQELHYSFPFVRDTTRSDRFILLAYSLQVIAATFVVTSLGFFLFGIYAALGAVTNEGFT